MKFLSNCRHFKGNYPCLYHKKEDVHCDGCTYYEPINYRILIIKLDAIGDVLRTTSILLGLREKHQSAHITWVTKSGSVALLQNNSCVDEVLEYSAFSFAKVQIINYDLVINLDTSPESAIMCTLAKGKEKLGYAVNTEGIIYPINQEAVRWFEMGLFDDLKKKNSDTYQKIILDICRLNPSNYDLIFNLTPEEQKFGRNFFRQHKLDNNLLIGLNTGAGGRWENKKWTVKGFLELIKLLKNKIKRCKILLYGGPEEKERNKDLKRRVPSLIDTGCNNTLREFAALLDLCNVVVTGDTLAMQLAIALKKKVVVLFGPTSHTEIELYGRGEKVIAPLPCICCYRTHCDTKPNCMESITPIQVFESLKKILKITAK